jgi:predicted ArsR family transcriptional regulator
MTNEDPRTLEQVYRSAVSGLYGRLRSNYDFLYRRFGKEGLKLIEEMSREYGLSVAQRAKARLESNDLASVAEYLLRIFDTVARGRDMITTTEKSPDKVIIKVNRCPLDFNIPEMCQAHTTMEKTVVEELNPNLVYRIGKSIPAGDCCCEHILERNLSHR